MGSEEGDEEVDGGRDVVEEPVGETAAGEEAKGKKGKRKGKKAKNGTSPKKPKKKKRKKGKKGKEKAATDIQAAERGRSVRAKVKGKKKAQAATTIAAAALGRAVRRQKTQSLAAGHRWPENQLNGPGGRAGAKGAAERPHASSCIPETNSEEMDGLSPLPMRADTRQVSIRLPGESGSPSPTSSIPASSTREGDVSMATRLAKLRQERHDQRCARPTPFARPPSACPELNRTLNLPCC